MDEILDMTINEMPLAEFDCSCGRHHSFPVHDISIRKGAIEDLPRVCAPFKDGKLLVVFDSNTYEVAGRKAVELLKDAGFDVKELLFETGKDILIPDERTVGRILLECELGTSLIVAVGSGSINDSVKFVTSRMKIPYVVVGTAPSMDGYVSDGAPVIIAGRKYSPLAHLTYGLIGDTDILATAPQDLISAGFGDVVGKITALVDWDLSVKVTGEYRCDTCCTLTQRALDKCFATADGLPRRDGEALGALMEALTMTGVAMALINVSRPASGTEHLFSHFWEMDSIARGENPHHHGLQVGVATPVVARIYQLLSDILPEGTAEMCPSPDEIRALLACGGAPTTPPEIGIGRELFHDSVMGAADVRPRYSVLRFARDNGRLESIADQLTQELYG